MVKQKTFAEWCGVKPPSVAEMIKRGILHSIERKIDIEDPANLSYLSRHNPTLAQRIYNGEGITDGTIQPKNTPVATNVAGIEPQKQPKAPPGKKRIDKAKHDTVRSEWESGDTDGFGDIGGGMGGDIGGLTPAEFAEVQRKQLYDAQKARLAAQREAVNLDILHESLGERAVFESFILELWQSIQRNYIDVYPKQAALICKRLGMVGHELEVIEVLEADGKKRQDNVAHQVRTVLEGKMVGVRVTEGEAEE